MVVKIRVCIIAILKGNLPEAIGLNFFDLCFLSESLSKISFKV